MLRTYRRGISGELALSQQPKKLSWHSGNDDDMILPKATSYFTHDACTYSTYILPCIITQPLFFKSPVIKKLVAQAMVDFHTTEGFFVLLFHGIFFSRGKCHLLELPTWSNHGFEGTNYIISQKNLCNLSFAFSLR